jgi:hypothetical protein
MLYTNSISYLQESLEKRRYTMAALKKAAPSRRGKQKTAPKKTASARAKKVYTCRTCGRTTTDRKHLCNPGRVEAAYTCEYCGGRSTNPLHLCKPKVEDARYYCDACGRISISNNLLCKPKPIK